MQSHTGATEISRKIVFEHSNLRLEYIKAGNYIHETWWGVTPTKVFVFLVNEILKALEENDSDGLLLDARLHKGLSPEALKIATKIIGAFAKTKGRLREAIVFPEDLLSNYSVKNYAERVVLSGPVIVEFFNTLEEAEKWLRDNENG